MKKNQKKKSNTQMKSCRNSKQDSVKPRKKNGKQQQQDAEDL